MTSRWHYRRSSISSGFTLVELLVGTVILSLLMSVGLVTFRNTRRASSSLARNIEFQMQLRHDADLLSESLLDCTEAVKPLEGSSLPFLAVRTIVNDLRLYFLEKATDPRRGPFQLVSYSDQMTGAYQPKNRTVLFGDVKEVTFTTLSPGQVTIHLTLQHSTGLETSVVMQVALKNFESIDDA